MEFQLPTVLLGNILRVDERFESLFHVMMGENEDLGGSDRIKPFLDPTPDGWKEGRSTNDLFPKFVRCAQVRKGRGH